MNNKITTIIADIDSKRIDTFITSSINDISRAMVQKLIKDGNITLNGKPVKAREEVRFGDKIIVNIPPPIKQDEVLAEAIALEIIYQDDDIAIINKPAGLVVHPGAGNWSGTLVNALLYNITDLSGIGGVVRPGIVHRLDKDTSGLICIAKNDYSHQKLAKELETREMTREYIAIAYGKFEDDDFTVSASIGRSITDRKKMAVIIDDKTKKREAKTDFTVIERFSNSAIVRAKLYTGRTHQIRVHLNYLGHPVLNDPIYGLSVQKKYLQLLSEKAHGALKKIKGQALHAEKLILTHPKNGEKMTFVAEMPKEMQELVNDLRGE